MTTSRNITVFLTSGTKKIDLDEPFLTGHDTTIQLKRATVFWKFQNVTKASGNYYFDKKPTGGSVVKGKRWMMGTGISSFLKNG